jgi:hypothetical protein
MEVRMARYVAAAAGLVLVTLAMSVSAAEEKAGPPTPMEMTRSGYQQAVSTREVTQTAKVKAVDPAARTLTIEGPRGVRTFKVSDAVKRLDEISPGDDIVLKYVQGLTLQVLKKGENVESTTMATAERAGKDEPPGGSLGTQLRGTVTVVAIDKPSRIVVLEDPDGILYKVKAGKDINLNNAKSGTKLMAVYGESTAVSVEKPPAPPK